MKLVCPFCGLGGTVDAELKDKKVRCPECQKVFQVTDEVIVEDPTAVLDSQDTVAADGLAGEEVDDQIGDEVDAAEESGADTNLDEENLLTCARCGFSLSKEFITIVDEQPVCKACAS